MNLPLKDLIFGYQDAKTEFQKDESFFIKSFLLPPDFPVESYYTGEKCFILGPKGSGKTALLNYIYSELQKNNSSCKFILYKSDINDDDREDFLMQLDSIDISSMSDEEIIALNFQNIWQLYFHQQIVKEAPSCFVKNKNWKRYVSAVNEIDKKNTFTLENIKIMLSAHTRSLSADGEAMVRAYVKKRQYNKLAAKINEYFSQLDVDSSKPNFYFLIDELELNRLDKKKFLCDSAMIRDLIIAVTAMNSMSQSNGFCMHWIAAIRTEVVHSESVSGKEINKVLLDNGRTLNWDINGGNNINSPIIKILMNKIRVSENNRDISQKNAESDAAIFKRYFPQNININESEDTISYILRQTFLLPRDIVRLFNLLKEKSPDERFFTKPMFESIRSRYAQETWSELAEELTAKYTPIELTGIRDLLSYKSSFTPNEFIRIAKSNQKDHEIRYILNNRDLNEVLSDLYDVSAIGNLDYFHNVTFYYRGQTKIKYNLRCIIHDSIRKLLH